MIASVLAGVIFILMFVLIIWDKFERHLVTLACGAATLVLVFGVAMHSGRAVMATLNVKSIFTSGFWYETTAAEEEAAGVNWATILFLAGMMVMVEGMARAGFFRWLCMTIAKAVHYKVMSIFLTFMVMSFVLAMFIDSITVILFLAAVTIELAQLLKFDPVPMILSEIFCANLGGSATMSGDPPNIIIGTSLKYTFTQFITNTGVIALISLVVIVIYFYFCFRKELAHAGGIDAAESARLSPKAAIESRRDFAVSTVIFLAAVVLLITHAQTGLSVASIGALVAVVTLAAAGRDAL